MQAAVKIDEKLHVFKNGKGAVDPGFTRWAKNFGTIEVPLMGGIHKKSFWVTEKCIGKK